MTLSRSGRGLSLQALRGLVPDGALASDALWARVAERVESDPCVRRVGGRDGMLEYVPPPR